MQRSAPTDSVGATADRRARGAVTTIFCLNGFLAALWVAHIPVITEHTGTGHELLGVFLLLIGAAAFAGMQVCGPLIDRIGSRPTTIVAAVVLCPVMLGPVLATGPTGLAVALIAFGFVNGSLDVSMNAQAVQVERAHGRPIMSAFHGFFSVGGLAGSGVVAVGLWFGWPVQATVAVLAACGLVVVAVVAGGLVDRDYGHGPADADVPADTTAHWWHGIDRRRLILLAAVAFAAMLAEGTAYDWSALHVVETFGVREAVGAIAFGCFSAAMMIARFVIDPIVGRVGAVAVVRYGSVIGMVGISIALIPAATGTAPAVLGVVGWTVFGIGLAGLIPQIFTAAGNLTARSSGRVISVVVGCGYLGMLAGPAIVGFISGQSTLRVGLTPVVAMLAFATLAAGVVAPRRDGGPDGDRGDQPPQGVVPH
ncbi:MFS transporter [Gordonia sp. NPDC003376]